MNAVEELDADGMAVRVAVDVEDVSEFIGASDNRVLLLVAADPLATGGDQYKSPH
ncbi:MAG: hypothetical protein KY462_04955 [Actinobacteria bacterium]|nr:hypothetical protein [Actinomycetota bacterium]